MFSWKNKKNIFLLPLFIWSYELISFKFYVYFQDLLVTVFENGKLLKDYTFDEVRERAELELVKNKKLQK